MRLTSSQSSVRSNGSTIALLMLSASGTCLAGDWLMFGHDPQRSGWAFEETTLSPANVSGLSLKWKAKLKNDSYSLFSLTAPVVAGEVSTSRGVRSVVYVAGITGTVFALDAVTGEELWTHVLKAFVLPFKGGLQGSIYCPNGVTATPVIDKNTGILYVLSGDGADGIIYTVLAQGCGGGLSGFYSVDVRDAHHPTLRQMLLSNTNTAGIWGRGGPIIGTNGRVYGGTADGMFDPIAGDYSNSVVAAVLPDLKLADYYLPPNWRYLHKKDFDLGSASPVFFGWRNHHLVAHGAKEGVVNLMDADALGGKDHQTPLYTSPRLGNDKATCCEAYGVWGGLRPAGTQTVKRGSMCPWAGRPPRAARNSRSRMATILMAALWHSRWSLTGIRRIRCWNPPGFLGISLSRNLW